MTEELKTKLKLVRMVKEWLRTEHPEGNVQSLVHLILIFVEPREKQIQIDAEQIRALQKQNGELTDKVRELEAQIEEMKCCENCAFFKDKTYDICHRIKKLGTGKCAFYKMI